ncbi:MAG TPA: HD domain-containing protein [Spirochaetota bacterium]|nr:HD domain-containing protein [Spirochaetota bacterium]HPS85752.1 HD domain-containing protein [Spirochaetota bacterium]
MVQKKMFGKVIRSIRLIFSRLKFKYKLTVYFTLFGLLVGYLSFIFYTTAATNHLHNIVSRVADDWLENNDLPGDIIESYTGSVYNEKMNIVFPFVSIFKNNLAENTDDKKIVIYYYSIHSGKWFKLFKAASGIITKDEIPPDEEIQVSSSLKKGRVSYSNSVFYGKSDNINFWINLTRPHDKNIYVAKIISSRKGALKFIGGGEIIFIYGLALFLVSLLLSKFIALHISKPISSLSSQTAGIASGNLDIRTEIVSKDEIGELSLSINIMADRIKENMESLNKRIEAISVMNKIDKAVLSSISRHDLIDRVTFIVSELFSDCMVSLAMVDNAREKYVVLSHYIKGIKGVKGEGLILTFDNLGKENIEKNKSFFIIGNNTDKEYLDLLNSLIHENFLHLMNLPIYLDEEYIGSLIIRKDIDRPFTDFETETLKALADQTGVAMKSVKFFEEKENLFLGILLALSKTIDAKSKWTSGHSERVTEYSAKLAVMMGMSETFLSDLKVSSNLHDIGKIGVPESILDKPEKLSPEEFDIIKRHPHDGATIIEEIPGYEKFINGIIFHHEAWDGSGYPFGLEGRSIPLMGRLIAVADVYDSLISDRPYRNGMSTDEALAIMISEKGRKLDPEIVDLMIEIIESEKNKTDSIQKRSDLFL